MKQPLLTIVPDCDNISVTLERDGFEPCITFQDGGMVSCVMRSLQIDPD